jgi:hypothetical protein
MEKLENLRFWDRQRDSAGNLEPSLWYSRFLAFRLMGPGRSLLGCVNQEREQKGEKRRNSVPGAWFRACEKWRWRERAEAWDAHQRQEDETLWREHRRELRKQEWAKAQDLLDRVEQMLRFPLAEITRTVEERGPDGEPITVVQVIKPVHWRVGDIARFLETASKLARLAAEMETERTKVGVALDDVLAGLPPEFGAAVRAALVEALSRRRG